jgi:hypothetical protein
VLEFIIITCNFLYIVIDSGRSSLLPIENDIATFVSPCDFWIYSILDIYLKSLFNILYFGIIF